MKNTVLLAAVAALVSIGAVRAADENADNSALYGRMDAPLLVCGAGRAFLVTPDGGVAWNKSGCGNIHRVWLHGGWVYWSNGGLYRTEVVSGKTEGVYMAGEKEGLYGFEVLRNGNIVVAENGTDFVSELKAGSFEPVVRFKANSADANGKVPGAHSHFRMIRKTAAGTYLVCCSAANVVREYDAGGKLVWEQPTPVLASGHAPLAFDALRRANGNTLISHLGAITEFTPDHRIVWQFTCADAPELKLDNLCGIQEKPNGNLVVGTYANGVIDGSRATAFELTRDKRVVWSYHAAGKRFSMMTAFAVNAADWPAALKAADAAAEERELKAMLPTIFAKSAAHYRALDAAAKPLAVSDKPVRNATESSCNVFPHGFKRDQGVYDMRSVFWWTSGHYPGALLYLYEATGEKDFLDRAKFWLEPMKPNSKVTSNHDVGFIMYCSFGNARRLEQTTAYDALLVETAASLSERFNPRLGVIRSWGKKDEAKNFLVIPDNMMNLELLESAAKLPGGEKRFADIARSHADVSMKNHFRPDGGCYHVLNYDQRDVMLGQIQEIRRGQGLCVGTAWSRGQSWGIYGYSMMYRMTGLKRYLDFAMKLADYAMNHPSMPNDGIPTWDYGAPGEERDSSAGAIMASALLEISTFVEEPLKSRYRAFAVKQLKSLASPAYFSEGGEIGHFLLKHGVGSKPSGSEIDTPLDYGDYYFLEALLRFRKIAND